MFNHAQPLHGSKLRAFFVVVCSMGAPKKVAAGGGGGAKGGAVKDLQVTIYLNAGTGNAGKSVSKVRSGMDLVSELVQDLTKYFKIPELESEAEFPGEMTEALCIDRRRVQYCRF